MTHPLDNAVYDSLGTTHARFAKGVGAARRFEPAVSSLAGVADPADAGCWADLARLHQPGARTGLLLWDAPDVAGHVTVRRTIPLAQMVWEGGKTVPAPVSGEALELGPLDAADMLTLVMLTEPGPMELRTLELGRYIGIRDDTGRLVAMAGERLRLPGWTEVSAICTHPSHRGRGLARSLSCVIMAGIVARGETPFLHVAASNSAAIALYESLGFRIRRTGVYVMLDHRGGDDAD